jgi:hypothetical protein
MLFLIISCTKVSADNIQELKFVPIELSTSMIDKFQFLKKFKNDNGEHYRKWKSNYETDLTLPATFPEIKISLAQDIKLNEEIYHFLYIEDKWGEYCTNSGCTILIYKNDKVFDVSNSGGMMPKILQCKDDNYVLKAGGAGMKSFIYIVNRINNNNLEVIHKTNTRNPKSICKEIKD